ncbi:Asp-tRNA(Asn)/Glu-tRNA(Gln) amidotransferase subunit GatC [Candidatus Nitrosocosmicus arcticus]|uniref:Putative Aspartyl/glutamyl-tRNA(Asn/Gln) amidotransferase subunit C n=1 Tax=Candidatus Nitrosocosmicus arcticus TaxID=2035267 RepID=A0A557SYU0_9ARCH|nr:Asp-tRNA(Asn)/Glu-tRNA(Gln) amidotransferase subunit GatC [Candidatus Nitrosocosmicus arcticus]TVP41766.1 putative Aspartyl/glutamyl-tRNA(Asn/Gln) amidotransferase subunit C [Candidatus Nitrosocosmicus arcticus]
MAVGIDIKKLCDLAKLEIPEQNIPEISAKVKEVLLMFDQLDEFITEGVEIISTEDLKFERAFENLRDDIPRPNLEFSGKTQPKIKLKNIKDGFVLGPRI